MLVAAYSLLAPTLSYYIICKRPAVTLFVLPIFHSVHDATDALLAPRERAPLLAASGDVVDTPPSVLSPSITTCGTPPPAPWLTCTLSPFLLAFTPSLLPTDGFLSAIQPAPFWLGQVEWLDVSHNPGLVLDLLSGSNLL